PMRPAGIWTCPTATACSDIWRTCSSISSTASAAGSNSLPAISTTFRSGTRICTSRRSSIRDRRSDMRSRKVLGGRQRVAPARGGDGGVPGGRWQLGSTAADGFIFDNEKWAHEVEIAPFRIAKAPVTNAEFAAFIDSGGYRRREFWSAAGWTWRERLAAEQPV